MKVFIIMQPVYHRSSPGCITQRLTGNKGGRNPLSKILNLGNNLDFSTKIPKSLENNFKTIREGNKHPKKYIAVAIL